jgi:tetratricopeptide (TPR) repeat protein
MLKIGKPKIIACFFAAIFVQLFSDQSFAVIENNSNNDLIKEIEKTLLFDKDSREKINVYQKKSVKKKSDYTIGAALERGASANNNIDIVVVDPKSENFDLREKEKLAYNAALVGQYEVAVELYKQVVVAEPDNSYSKFSLAVVYQKLGQITQAKALYRDLLKSDPANEEEIIGNLLAILIEESPKDALYLLSRLTAQNPKSAYVLAQAAIVYDKIKNYDQAINLFQKAIDLDPKNLGYKYNLAVIYDKTSQFDKALDFYLEVEKDYSDDQQLIAIDQVQKRIQAIRNKV